MKNKAAKMLALLLAAMMLVTLLAACGGSDSSSDSQTPAETQTDEDGKDDADAADDGADAADTDDEVDISSLPVDEFSYLITVGDNHFFWDSYNDNPALRYWLSKPWTVDGEKRMLDIDVWEPPAGSEGDYANNLLATAEYPDVISIAITSMGAKQMLDEGIALDITEEVEKYMPNYMQWIEDHDYYDFVTNDVDGERRFIQIYDVCDETGDMWGGYIYRRDWIIKYGKNPETGEAFSGDWEDDEWVDDVVFPSGNTDPMYISDWEWMLDIFATALEEEGIDDGYALQLPYYGAQLTGDFITGFGGGGMWYLDDNQECQFGVTEDHTKAYVECMSTWWDNGWIDPGFQERTSEMFFSTDSAGVYSGKVGVWYGTSGQLGDRMGGDMVTFGAPQPINDVYGTADDQGHDPTNYLTGGLANTSFVVTNKAKDKNIGTLLTAIDALYVPDGGMLRNYGLSKEQQAEFQSDLYNEYGLEDGAYEKVYNDDGSYTYVLNPNRDKVDELSSAACMMRILGMTPQANLQTADPDYIKHSIKNWTMYPDKGNIPSTVSNQLDADAAQEQSLIQSNMITYVSQNLPLFIIGEKSLDDDWDDFVQGLDDIGVQQYCGQINEILGK